MNVEIKALGLTLTDELATYCHDHLVAPLRRIFDREGAELEIELSDDNGPKGGLDKRCRLTFRMPYVRTLTIVEQAADPHEAVDLASARLRRLVQRYKGWKLSPDRRPTKYYVSRRETGGYAPDRASPEELDPAIDSLGAHEERDREASREAAGAAEPLE